MSIGVLLVTHPQVGVSLLHTAERIMGACPLQTECLDVSPDADVDRLAVEVAERVQRLDQSDGVLILTDLYGATPTNLATRVGREFNVDLVAGINLPMMLKVINYAELDLTSLRERVLYAGRQGIVSVDVDTGSIRP